MLRIERCSNQYAEYSIFPYHHKVLNCFACCLQILKMLNSNTENPYLIWDNATRAELTEFLESEQLRKIKTVNYLYKL